MKIIDVLLGVSNGEIPVDGLELKVVKIEEEKEYTYIYKYDETTKSFKREGEDFFAFMTEDLTDLDLAELDASLSWYIDNNRIPRKDTEKIMEQWKHQVYVNSEDNLINEYENYEDESFKNADVLADIIFEIEKLYIDLEMELDACQGCCDDVDFLLEKLNKYKEIVKSLGGDIETDKERLCEDYYARVKAEETRKKEEEMQKKHKFDDIEITPMKKIHLMTSQKEDEKLLFEIIQKVNNLLKDRRND